MKKSREIPTLEELNDFHEGLLSGPELRKKMREEANSLAQADYDLFLRERPAREKKLRDKIREQSKKIKPKRETKGKLFEVINFFKE